MAASDRICIRRKRCSKGFACVLLGECVYGHPMIKDNDEAKFVIRSTISLRQTCLVFHRIAKGEPLKRPNGKPVPPKRSFTEILSSAEEPILQLNSLDPVTQRIRNARLKRIAESDAKKGYIYSESEMKNFHIQ